MRYEEFQTIAHLEGLDFIRALLDLEERRFGAKQFMRGSTFEDINADFGIFPTLAAYPVYFAGDVRRPKNKFVFMGINPGFKIERNLKEQSYLKSRGLFEGYCELFSKFKPETQRGLAPYFANIAGFIRRCYGISEPVDWNWLQEHFIMLELIPYHSANSNGLRINDLQKYRDVYFEINLKLLRHINPTRPVFINGFPTYRSFFESKNKEIRPEFRDVLEFRMKQNIAVGKISRKFDFIGLPFLNRPRGGVDAIARAVRRVNRRS